MPIVNRVMVIRDRQGNDHSSTYQVNLPRTLEEARQSYMDEEIVRGFQKYVEEAARGMARMDLKLAMDREEAEKIRF
jgi:hypothetical protein